MPTFYHSADEMITAAIATMRNLATTHAARSEQLILQVYHYPTEHLSGYYPVWLFTLETPEGVQIDGRSFAIDATQHGGHFLDKKSANKFYRTLFDEISLILGKALPLGGWIICESEPTAKEAPEGWTVADTANEDMPEPEPEPSAIDTMRAPATPHADEPVSDQFAEIDFAAPALFTRIQCAALAIRNDDAIIHSPAIVGIRADGSKRVFVNWEVTFRDPENGERDAIAFASSEIGLRLEAEWEHATRMQEETGVFFISAERMLANLTSEWS